MSEDVLGRVFARMGVVVLERGESGEFRLLGTPPGWWASLHAGPSEQVDPAALSPFLENFMFDAKALWEKGEAGRVYSGVWIEELGEAGDTPLEAIAVRLDDGRDVLLIETVASKYLERLELLQKARVASLEHEELLREVQKKEVLLHCIVHDLRGPLSGMLGGFSLLQSPTVSPQRRDELAEMGLAAANRQLEMISQVLDVFSAEIESMDSFAQTEHDAPDLADCAREIARGLSAAFQERDVALELRLPQEPLKVVGRTNRLERVFSNLLENALRHAPEGTVVTLGAGREGDQVRAWIADRGPGVPEEVRDTLFEKFASAGARRGVAGLGLYFCRYTVETWGGTIGHEPVEGGGARFWFRLPVPAR